MIEDFFFFASKKESTQQSTSMRMRLLFFLPLCKSSQFLPGCDPQQGRFSSRRYLSEAKGPTGLFYKVKQGRHIFSLGVSKKLGAPVATETPLFLFSKKREALVARASVRSFLNPFLAKEKHEAISLKKICIEKNRRLSNLKKVSLITPFAIKQRQVPVLDFVDIQRKSFFTLLEKGLIEEFSKRNPITNTTKTLELFFYPEYYQLTLPEYTPSQAIIQSKSYTARLYIPVQLTDRVANLIKLKWVYIGNIPLMTKRGHFILNGCARVIVNQMIRSPGIYYQKKVYENYEDKWSEKPDTTFDRYYADLICNRGTWLRLEIDKYNQIWAQMKRVPKIPIMWLLLGMGLPEKMILKRIVDSQMLLYNLETNNYDITEKPYPESTGDFENDSTAGTPFGDTRPLSKDKEKTSAKKVGKVLSYIQTPPAAWSAIYNLVMPFSKAKGSKESKKTKTFTEMRAISDKNKKEQTTVARPRTSQQNLSLDERQKTTKQDVLAFTKVKHVKANSINNIPVKQGRSSVLSLQGMAKPGLSEAKGQIENNVLRDAKNVTELGRKWLFNRFMNPRTYDLGKIGRLNFNSKLNLTISVNQTTLTPQDLLLATDYLILVAKGLREVDDIDHLKNRRVRTSGELIQLQIGVGLVRLEKAIREKLNKATIQSTPKSLNRKTTKKSNSQKSTVTTDRSNLDKSPILNKNSKSPFGKKSATFTPADSTSTIKTDKINKAQLTKYGSLLERLTISSIVNTKPFNGALKEFFGSSPLSQFMDQINPLAELTHKRRLSSMGPGGVTRDSATLEIRGIHPSHYGRICPVETPEGKNTGLVNSLTAYARVNADGYIETPFYRVYKGQVQKKTGLYFFSAKQEEKIKLGAADLYTTNIGFLPLSSIPVRIVEDFTKIPRNAIEYVGVAPIQMISIATSLIPFFEHDDGNRALMGSNMQRQAVPILKPQRPIVGTGLEARAVSDSGHVVQTKQSGLITYVSSTKIQIYYF